MKKSLIGLFVIFSSLTGFSQKDSINAAKPTNYPPRKNAIKIGLPDYSFLEPYFQYERFIKRKLSIAVNSTFAFEPYKTSSHRTVLSSYSIAPELRYYLFNKKDFNFQGLYISAIIQFKHQLKRYHYFTNRAGFSPYPDFKYRINSLGIYLPIGYQLFIKKKILISVNIGPGLKYFDQEFVRPHWLFSTYGNLYIGIPF